MPVLVQWKWNEKTKSYLVIFHFFDDFSASNLRTTIYEVSKSHFGEDIDLSKRKSTPLLTWAPSHIELGLLSEILSYANRINGLKHEQKLEIRDWLEGKLFHVLKEGKLFGFASVTNLELLEASKYRQLIIPSKEGTFQCFWLTPEYIEYLKKGLKTVQEPDSVKKTLKINKKIYVARFISPEGVEIKKKS